MANIFTGQMFHTPPDIEFFKRQAKEFGFEEKSYLDAVTQVNIIPEEQMPPVMEFLAGLAGMIGNMGLLHLRQLNIEKELENKVAERTIELQNSLDEIKNLRGILPICSFCKNIRNDEGYYEQIEGYFHKHSGVDFSHTICPTLYERKLS